MELTLFERARQEFPGAIRRTYVDIAARNPLSLRVRAAIEAYLDDRQDSMDNKSVWFSRVEQLRVKVARLINAEPDQIAFMKNTSHGLASVITALPWHEGDNVVIAPDFEHPNNVYAWLGVRDRGVSVKQLPLERSGVTIDQIKRAVDDRTRAVGIASVSFATGVRVDLDAIAQFCRERDVFLMVDGVQSVGVIDLDVKKTPIDGLAAATSKSLLALYGMGILYCRDAEALKPVQLSRFSVDVDSEHEYAMGDINYKLASGARRFEIGNYNYLAVHALHAAVDQIAEIGVPTIEKHALALSGALTKGLVELGYQMVSSTDPAAQSHIVVFAPPAGGPTIAAVSTHLNQNDIRHTIRRFGLRMSFHMYNNQSDVDRILDVLARMPGAKGG
jgi:selenocysteine lyase/cysteine desulfurase